MRKSWLTYHTCSFLAGICTLLCGRHGASAALALVPAPVLNGHLDSPTWAFRPVRYVAPAAGDSVWTRVRACAAAASR